MSFLKRVAGEFAARKLWPVALLLLAALIGIPVLLAKSPASRPAAPVAPVSAPVAKASVIPVLSVINGPYSTPVQGRERDPFSLQRLTKKLVSMTAFAPRPASQRTASAAASSSGGGSTPAAPAPSHPAPASARVTPSAPIAPVPASPQVRPSSGGTAPAKRPAGGLAPTDSYHVAVVMTNAGGGVDSMDPVKRLSPLPGPRRPLLIELGVAQAGKRVLFAVPPGTQLSGPGICTPGPTDCQVVALAPDQIESLSSEQDGVATSAGQLVVSEIAVDHHANAAAANAARRAVDADGSRLLAETNLTALALFAYRPRLGVMVNLSNLTVEAG